MPIREEKFDQERIDSLRRYLQRESDKGRKKDFEIIVDGFKVISRTDDISEFDDYEQEIKADTQSISILIYDGPATNRNTKYTFLLHGEPALNGTGIGGATNSSVSSIGKLIQEKLDAKERELELSRVKEQLAAKEKELEEAEEYQDILLQQIKDLENGQRQKAIGWSELAGFFVNGYLKQNPHLLKKIPIAGETLAGMLGAPAPVPELPANGNAEDTTEKASFEKKQTAQDAEETGWQLFRQQLQHSFNDEQQNIVLAIVGKLSNEPGQISKVAQLLNI